MRRCRLPSKVGRTSDVHHTSMHAMNPPSICNFYRINANRLGITLFGHSSTSIFAVGISNFSPTDHLPRTTFPDKAYMNGLTIYQPTPTSPSTVKAFLGFASMKRHPFSSTLGRNHMSTANLVFLLRVRAVTRTVTLPAFPKSMVITNYNFLQAYSVYQYMSTTKECCALYPSKGFRKRQSR